MAWWAWLGISWAGGGLLFICAFAVAAVWLERGTTPGSQVTVSGN